MSHGDKVDTVMFRTVPELSGNHLDIEARPSYPSLPLSLAKKLGVTEVPLEVVNFISHATQSRLRSLLEKVSAVAQHRTDGAKVRTARSLHAGQWV